MKTLGFILTLVATISLNAFAADYGCTVNSTVDFRAADAVAQKITLTENMTEMIDITNKDGSPLLFGSVALKQVQSKIFLEIDQSVTDKKIAVTVIEFDANQSVRYFNSNAQGRSIMVDCKPMSNHLEEKQ